MERAHVWGVFGLASFLAAAVAIGCSGDDASPEGAKSIPPAGTPPPEAPPGPPGATPPTVPPPPGSASVTFHYTPQWSGATKVEVVGGFGQATDWSETASLVTLTGDGAGNFTGSASVPNGHYLYVFRVTGDDQVGAMGATYVRYAFDPSSTAYSACPMASPTYSKEANPCSAIDVPAGAAAPSYHVKGTVHADDAPATGYIVVLERDEKDGHHFFANRVTTKANGAFDIIATAGSWRLQIQHPTFLSKNDTGRDPVALQAIRRSISADIVLASDVTIDTPDVAFHDYGTFGPSGDAGPPLPTTFTFGTANQRLEIYDGPKSIGDPWYTGSVTTSGSSVWDGGFNTSKAQDDAAVPGTKYFWGTEISVTREAGVKWTNQTMVFPIAWQ